MNESAEKAAGVDLRSRPVKLHDSRRAVVKIGSILLVDDETGRLRSDWLAALIEDVVSWRARGTEIILVSSGAIAVGRKSLGLDDGDLRLEEKQAAAAAGQIRLAHAYQKSLARHDVSVAQILLTLDDTEERRKHLNARATIETLLRLGSVPVINENDSVATTEIRFGDNDRLAARVAQMSSADTLVLLSDIDGLYTADPRRDRNATLVPELSEITPEIEAMAGEAPTGHSSGGMVTKIEAARIALAAGCRMVIADGKPEHALSVIDQGARCTWFLPQATPLNARKRWIAGTLKTRGTLNIDAGALKALNQGRSLLPAGITDVEGDFERGDLVIVKGPNGKPVGRGLCAYSVADANLIKGHKSRDIEALLGYRGRDEMIHRDDLVLD